MLTEKEIFNQWPFNEAFAYQIFQNFNSNVNITTFEELLIKFGDKKEQEEFFSISEKKIENLLTSENAYYGVEGFFKKNNILYYNWLEKKVLLNLNVLTLECVIASCTHYLLIKNLNEKSVTSIFFCTTFEFLMNPRFHYIILNILKEYNVFEKEPVKLIEGLLLYFKYTTIQNFQKDVYRSMYVNLLHYIKIPINESMELVDLCFSKSNFDLIINYLINYMEKI